jgi:hypothetical protein
LQGSQPFCEENLREWCQTSHFFAFVNAFFCGNGCQIGQEGCFGNKLSFFHVFSAAKARKELPKQFYTCFWQLFVPQYPHPGEFSVRKPRSLGTSFSYSAFSPGI